MNNPLSKSKAMNEKLREERWEKLLIFGSERVMYIFANNLIIKKYL